jgi:integrase
MLKTKSGLPKHCTMQIDRHGARRVRFRTRTVSAYLTGAPWTEEFMRQYAALKDRVEAKRADGVGGERSGPGSINALIASYRRLVFPTLAPTTRAMRNNILERFGREHGGKRVAHLQHEHVASIIAAKAATPHAANNLRKVLRHMLDHAVDLRLIENNPAARVRKLKTAGEGLHCWTDDEIERYRAHWRIGTQMRLAMELAFETTSRRADVTRIGPQHRRTTPDGEVLDLRHSKNDSRAVIPLTDELRDAIDAMPVKHLTYLHTKHGAPRSPKALGGDFRQWCDAAGLPKRCSIHGLRKAGAVRLADAGASAPEIMSITGHKSLAEAQRYVTKSDKAKLARQAMEKRKQAKR